MSDMIPTVEDFTNLLANLFAKTRTGGSVYMDGSHNPRPSERLIAKQFMEDLKEAGLLNSND
jgi:hypothetical protein